MKKRDIWLIGLLLAAALMLYLGAQTLGADKVSTVVVTIDGEEVLRKPLAVNDSYEIRQDDGSVNVITVENGLHEGGQLPRRPVRAAGQDAQRREDHRLPAAQAGGDAQRRAHPAGGRGFGCDYFVNPLKIWLEDARRAPDTRHVDACDGLRALAILIIGWFHIWQQSWLFPDFTLMGRRYSLDPLVRSGYIWVDAMILISGFCLYLPWARAREEGGALPAAADFYARRLMRIEPSYLLTLAVMSAVALATGAYASGGAFARDLISHLTYTHTFFY